MIQRLVWLTCTPSRSFIETWFQATSSSERNSTQRFQILGSTRPKSRQTFMPACVNAVSKRVLKDLTTKHQKSSRKTHSQQPATYTRLVSHCIHSNHYRGNFLPTGMVLQELATLKKPFADVDNCCNGAVWVLRLLMGARPPLPPDLEPECQQLIAQCWHQDPSMRPTFKEFLDHCDKADKKENDL